MLNHLSERDLLQRQGGNAAACANVILGESHWVEISTASHYRVFFCGEIFWRFYSNAKIYQSFLNGSAGFFSLYFIVYVFNKMSNRTNAIAALQPP